MKNWYKGLSVLLATAAMAAPLLFMTPPSDAAVVQVKGSAFGYQLNVSLFGGPVFTRGVGQETCTNPPTNNVPAGCVPADQAAGAASPSVMLPAGGSTTPITDSRPSSLGKVGPAEIFTSGQLDVSTQGTPGASGSVTSSSSIADVDQRGSESFGYGPLDASTLYPKNPSGLKTNVTSTCTASESGVSGSTTITNGQLETDNGYDPANNGTYAGTDPKAHPPVRVIVPTNPAPNTTYNGHIEVNGSQDYWKYVFNEQVTNPDGSLTVYAGHEYLLGPTAVGDLYFGKAECGVTLTSTTTLASSANPSVFGQPVNFTATVTSGISSAAPTGSVQFQIDGANYGSPVSLVGGKATSASTSALGAGPHTVQGFYGGNGNDLTGSTGTLTQTVNKAATTTAATSSTNPAGLTDQVTFTATVSPTAPGAGTRTGTVQFMDGTANLGSPTAVDGAGKASITMLGVQLGLGDHPITAAYAGDGNFIGSTSAPFVETVGILPGTTTTPTTTTTTTTTVPGGTSTGTTTTTVPGGGTITPFDATITPFTVPGGSSITLPGGGVLGSGGVLNPATGGVAPISGSGTATVGGPSLKVSSNQVARGDRVNLTGDQLPPGATLKMNFLSTPVALGTVVTNATGSFQTSVAVPGNAVAGDHHINVTDSSGRELASVALTVRSGNSGAIQGSLAHTGTNLDDLVLLGLATVLFGLFLFASPRALGNGP